MAKKKVLIVGANSYVGTSFEKWLLKNPDNYEVDTVGTLNDEWKEASFSKYDSILHVAGIAHVSSDPNMEELYYRVNRDLTIDVAKKAKAEGVKQFIFMSSIIVYGDSSYINERRVIDENTIPKPSNFYGNSKLQAEEGIIPLQTKDVNDCFNVVIIRPPMIYGKSSKGNYSKLSRIAQKLPLFPNVDNERSMLHIDNLCEFIRLMIDNEEQGVFFPQNAEYIKTSEMVKLIAKVHGKSIWMTKLVSPLLRVLGKRVNIINKVFGNLVYEKSMSAYKEDYCVRSLEDSINLTEGDE